MHVSLILATVDRTKEVKRFLRSLEFQTYNDVELIVVDQNPDDRLVPIINLYRKKFKIYHLRNVKRGLSRARNEGLQYATGHIISFPDDDCWYSPTLLEEVVEFFQEHPNVDGIIVPSDGDKHFIARVMGFVYRGKPRKVSLISLPNMERLFLRSKVVKTVGEFDETLGLGSGTPWIACDDMDYGVRILKAGFKLFRVPTLSPVYDPPNPEPWSKALDRTYRYGKSAGYVWRKHRLPLWLGIMRLGAASFALIESLLRGRFKQARRKGIWMQGFVKGWMGKNG